MRKVVATVVTCGLIGMSFISSPMSVEAVSSVSVESKDGNYSTMGFGGTFYEMEEAVNERLSEGPDNPIWFIASENCHTEAEYHFPPTKKRKIWRGSIIGLRATARRISSRLEPIWITASEQIWKKLLKQTLKKQ